MTYILVLLFSPQSWISSLPHVAFLWRIPVHLNQLFSKGFLICVKYKITQCNIFKIKSTVLCIYIDIDVFTRTTGKVKFSNFIPMHMTLIDSVLWVMMCSVSQCVAHSSRPWRGFDVCFIQNAYTLLYIQRDISCRMLGPYKASMWRKTAKSIILNDLKFLRLLIVFYCLNFFAEVHVLKW